MKDNLASLIFIMILFILKKIFISDLISILLLILFFLYKKTYILYNNNTYC